MFIVIIFSANELMNYSAVYNLRW